MVRPNAEVWKRTHSNDLILMFILHLLSDTEVLDGTSIDVYDNCQSQELQ